MDISLILEVLLKAFSCTYIYFFTIYNIPTIALNKLKIYKTSKYDGKIIRKDSIMNYYDMNDLKENLDNKKIEILLPFLEKIKNYISEENLQTAYKNLSTVEIKEKKPIGAIGCYYPKENVIQYLDSIIIGHEFLHLSSSYYDSKDNIAFSGFSQRKNYAQIGDGLNEGYTELLASRIYNNEEIHCYKKEVKIAKLLELFFDNPKDMEKLYFNYNLPGFIQYMEQFAAREEIINLILDIDTMKFINNEKLNPTPVYNYIKIQLTLYKWFINKKTDDIKIKHFESLISEDKIIALLLSKLKIKLYKQNALDENKKR